MKENDSLLNKNTRQVSHTRKLNRYFNIRQNKGQSIKDKEKKYVVEEGKAWTYAPKNIDSKNVEQQLWKEQEK